MTENDIEAFRFYSKRHSFRIYSLGVSHKTYAVFVRGKADKKVSNAGSGAKVFPERINIIRRLFIIYNYRLLACFVKRNSIYKKEEKI